MTTSDGRADRAEIEEMLPEANAKSKSDFVCQAVEFYIGYLRQQKNIDYLTPVLAGAIKSEVESVERHLSEMLFKLAVEQGVGNNLLAAISDVTPETLQALHDNCAQEVARTNGIIDMRYAYEWQKG